MCDDLISVVVPIFNLAPWLPRCVESILGQTHRNLEVLLVDDGSIDDSLFVAEEFAGRDPRVRVFHQRNAGVTAARMLGVSEARGSWIGFVDGDDEIESDMYARLLENARKYDADISHCGYQQVRLDGSVSLHHGTGGVRPQDHLTGLKDLLEERTVGPALWSKLYRRELFRELDGKMDRSIRINEDILMNFYLFSEAKQSVYEDFCPYRYIIRKGSAVTGRKNTHWIYDPIRVRQLILDACGEELKEDGEIALLRVLLYIYALLTVEDRKKFRADRDKVQALLAEERESFPLLSRRNRLLAGAICDAPWLFRGTFRLYVKLFRGGEYS